MCVFILLCIDCFQEEKEYNDKAVLETLRGTQATQAKSESKSMEKSEEGIQESENKENIYDTNAQIWHNLTRWAQTADFEGDLTSLLHPSLRQDGEWLEGMEVTQRTTTLGPGVEAQIISHDDGVEVRNHESLYGQVSQVNPSTINQDHLCVEGSGKCSSKHMQAADRTCNPLSIILQFVRVVRGRRERTVQEDTQTEEEEEQQEEEEDDDESDELKVSSSFTFILSQCIGWIVCCLFVGELSVIHY